MRPNRIVGLLIAFSLVFSLVLALNLIPQMRGGFGWRWAYAVPNDAVRVLPALVVVFGYVGLSLRVRSPRTHLLWSIGGSIAITLACLFILGDPLYLLFTRTVSGAATGPHEVGAEMSSVAATWQAWPSLMLSYLQPGAHPMLSAHVALDPPGLPTLFYLARRALAALPGIAKFLADIVRPYQCQTFVIMAYDNPTLASAWLGILTPLWGTVTVVPLYFATRKLYNESVARGVLIGWPLIPALATFTPTGNTLYPLFTVGALAALVAGLEAGTDQRFTRRWLWVGLAGLLTGLATFMNFSTLPVLGFLGLFVLMRAYARRDRWVKPVAVGLTFGLGLSIIWIIYWAISGHSPFDLLAVALSHHLELDRPYLPWLGLHLYDVALFIGIPVAGLAITGFVLAIRRGFTRKPAAGLWSPGVPTLQDSFALALALDLIMVDLSGVARGETARVWLFFMPLLLVVAAQVLRALTSPPNLPHPPTPSLRSEKVESLGSPLSREAGERPGVRASLFWLTQAIALLTLAIFVPVIGTELDPPPNEAVAVTAPQPAIATFGDAFALLDQHASSNVGSQGITLSLTWQARRQADVPYYFSALLVQPDGHPVAQALNWQPHQTRYPVTCWRPGAVITDTITIPFGNVPPRLGAWWISLSMFERATGNRLPVVDANGATDSQLGIGPVLVGVEF